MSEKLPVLNSTNYYQWSKSVQVVLQSKGYKKYYKYQSFPEWYLENHIPEEQEIRFKARMQLIQDDGTKNENQKKQAVIELEDKFHNDLGRWSAAKQKQQENWFKEDEMVKGIILSCVNESFKSKIKENLTTFEIWNILKESSGNDLGKAIILYRELIHLKIRDNEKLTSFLNRFELIIEKLSECDEAFIIPNIHQVLLILIALPDNYNMISQSISCANKEDLNLDFLRSKFSFEDSVKEAKSKEKSEEKKEKKESANFVKKERKCSECKAVLPFKLPVKFKTCKPCYLKTKDQKENNTNSSNNDNKNNSSEKKSNSHYVVLASNISQDSSSVNSNNWILDSGTSTSISNDKDDFEKLEKSNAIIYGPLGNSSNSTLSGKAILPIRNENKEEISAIELSNTIFSKEIKRKLLSVSQLTAGGDVFVLFSKDDVLVIKNGIITYDGDIVMQGFERHGLYEMLDTVNQPVIVNNLESKEVYTKLDLHKRFGHASANDLKKIIEYYDIEVKDIDEKIECESCIKGQMRRSNFKDIPKSSISAGDEIHSDLCGKLKPYSIDKKKYFVTYIDKKSDFMFVPCISKKSDVDEEYKNVVSLLKNQLELRTKKLVSDGEGTYRSNEFQDYLKKKGIIHQ
jgi:hypothetical protein